MSDGRYIEDKGAVGGKKREKLCCFGYKFHIFTLFLYYFSNYFSIVMMNVVFLLIEYSLDVVAILRWTHFL